MIKSGIACDLFYRLIETNFIKIDISVEKK